MFVWDEIWKNEDTAVKILSIEKAQSEMEKCIKNNADWKQEKELDKEGLKIVMRK